LYSLARRPASQEFKDRSRAGLLELTSSTVRLDVVDGRPFTSRRATTLNASLPTFSRVAPPWMAVDVEARPLEAKAVTTKEEVCEMSTFTWSSLTIIRLPTLTEPDSNC
jgi:hypothetical protein